MSYFPESVSKIESNLFGLWTDIGYTSTEREKQQKEIEAQIVKIFQNHVEKTNLEKEKLEEDIKTSLETLNNLQMALGKPISTDFNTDSSLRQQYNEINIEYNNLYNESKNIIDAFRNIQMETAEYYDKLGIPKESRGEFDSVGNKDLSDQRYQRFVVEKQELIAEIDIRTTKMKSLKEQINVINAQLEEEMPSDIKELFNTNSITDDSFIAVEQYLDSVEEEKNERIDKLKGLMKKIDKLWYILEISKKEIRDFTESHTTIGINSLNDCENELERLSKIRAKQLPELIAKQQETIIELSSFIHIDPEVNVEINPNEEECKEEIYGIYETEIKRLEKLKEKVEPILELINQREEMQSEYEKLMKLFAKRQKPKSYKYSTKVNDPKEIMKEENELRRIKAILPRQERKLKIALLEYRALNNRDFVYDGNTYIDFLDHIILSELEIGRAMTPKRKTRKSLAPSIPKSELLHDKTKNDPRRRKSENSYFISNL